MKSRRHTDREYYFDRNIEMYQKYIGGESINSLAKIYKLSPITVRKIIKARGLPQTDTNNYYLPDIDFEPDYTVLPKQTLYRIDG